MREERAEAFDDGATEEEEEEEEEEEGGRKDQVVEMLAEGEEEEERGIVLSGDWEWSEEDGKRGGEDGKEGGGDSRGEMGPGVVAGTVTVKETACTTCCNPQNAMSVPDIALHTCGLLHRKFNRVPGRAVPERWFLECDFSSCVCERENERERASEKERVCDCVRVFMILCVCVCVCAYRRIDHGDLQFSRQALVVAHTHTLSQYRTAPIAHARGSSPYAMSVSHVIT
eukprot:3456169-Rhodomonas_salina.3